MIDPVRIDLAGSGSICALARRLIADGADPDALAMVYRDATLCFQPMPLGRWAGLTTEETETRSIRFRSYRSRPPLKVGCKAAGRARRPLPVGQADAPL